MSKTNSNIMKSKSNSISLNISRRITRSNVKDYKTLIYENLIDIIALHEKKFIYFSKSQRNKSLYNIFKYVYDFDIIAHSNKKTIYKIVIKLIAYGRLDYDNAKYLLTKLKLVKNNYLPIIDFPMDVRTVTRGFDAKQAFIQQQFFGRDVCLPNVCAIMAGYGSGNEDILRMYVEGEGILD